MKIFIVLLFCFLYVSRAAVTCTLNPDITVNDGSSLNPACLQYYDNRVGATTGISTDYYVGNSTCGGDLITHLFVPFNVCTLHSSGIQPNCTVYTDCLAASKTFAAYTACLPTTTTNYVYYTAFNTTSYTESIYPNSSCVGLLSSSQIPYGCANTGLVDGGATDCLIYTNLYPSSDAGSLMGSFIFADFF